MAEPGPQADDNRHQPAGKSLRQRLNIPSDPLWVAGVIVCGAAMASLLLPWVWIDDWPEPMNAGSLLFFYLSSQEKWYLLRTTPLGVLTILFAPAFIITAVLTNAGLAIRNKPSGWLAFVTIAGILDLLWLTGEILDPDRPRAGPLAAPEIGLTLLLVCQLLIIGIILYRGYRDAPAGTRYRGIPLLSRPPADSKSGKRPSFEW